MICVGNEGFCSGIFRFCHPFLDLVFVLCPNAASEFLHVDFMLHFGPRVLGSPSLSSDLLL